MTQSEFDNLVWNEIGKTDEIYPQWFLREFCNHWGEKSTGAKKMRFEKEKIFNISMRLATFKRNSQEWHPKRWVSRNKNPQNRKAPAAPKMTTEEIEGTKQMKRAYEREIKEGKERMKKRKEEGWRPPLAGARMKKNLGYK